MLKKSEIIARLQAPFKVKLFDTVGSTNDLAAACPPYTAILARRQRAGRGRMGREFSSARGGIYLSAALPPSDAVMLTLKAGVAVARAVGSVTGRDCRIKWVNDVLLGGKKLCGILCERRAGSEVTVVGIGVNYCNRLPEKLADKAAVLSDSEEGISILAAEIINELYFTLGRDVTAEYKRLSAVLNRYVEADGRKYFAFDIAGDGGLMVRDESGTCRKLCAGEVSVLPL